VTHARPPSLAPAPATAPSPSPSRRAGLVALACAGAGLALPAGLRAQGSGAPSRTPDVVYVPTPQEIVDEMLKVASVGPKDVLYDLGSGDGRIPITAARRWGTRGVGIDIDPQRIRDARANATAAKVTDKVRFIQGDLFELDLTPATVITLYLLPELNVKLRPTLLKLKPGTRIVSHDFAMGDWKPQQTIHRDGRTVYFWTVPPAGQDYPRS
jgi:SAM-dependent methyltransferase